MKENIDRLVDAALRQHDAGGRKKRNHKTIQLVVSIGICIMFIAMAVAMIVPIAKAPGPSGVWDFWSNKPHIFNTNQGNVGIGTETPEFKVDIVGNRIRLNESTNSGSKTIELRTDGAAVDVNAYNADLFLHSWTGNTILQAFGGRVGIGTSPEYKLDVVGDEIRLRDSTDPLAKQVSLRTDGAAVDVNANNADLFLHSWTGNTILQAFGGRVGIGTGLPDAELHIKDATGHADLMLESNGGTKWNFGAATDRLFFATYDMGWQNYMIIEKDSGNIGIGAVAEYKLDVVGDEIRLRDTTDPVAKQALIRTDGAEVDVCANNANLFLHSYTGNTILQPFGGNVGIGTTNPARTLHINDVMRLEPLADYPSNAGDGDLCVVGTTGDYHIYCYLNGSWKQLD